MMLGHVVFLMAAQAGQPLDCSDAITQVDMNQCTAQEFRRADAELNTVWARVRTAMQLRDRETSEYRDEFDRRPGYYAALLESQRAWLRYRDAQCAIEGYSARGGSMEPMLISACRTHLTLERTDALRNLMEN